MFEAHFDLTELLVKSGQYGEALTQLKNVRALNPSHEAAQKLICRILAGLAVPMVL